MSRAPAEQGMVRVDLHTRFPLPPNRDDVEAWTVGPVLEKAGALIEARGSGRLSQLCVDWSLAGRTAGQARLTGRTSGVIRLNRQLFEYPEGDFLQLRDTVLHEMAHLCVGVACRRARPHGREWRWFATRLGAQPKRTHQLPLRPARASWEFAYRVGAETVWVGPIRHRRLQEGTVRYRIKCGGTHLVLHPDAFTGKSRRRG